MGFWRLNPSNDGRSGAGSGRSKRFRSTPESAARLSVGAEIGGGAAIPTPVPVDVVGLSVSCMAGLARESGVENDSWSLGMVVICHPSLLVVTLVLGPVGATASGCWVGGGGDGIAKAGC
jgi:hypothetical protein